ncbi:MAG: DUF2752 domain-containing protein [bacterium]|nr:DUF2752 domain-containing protein [bacterium]
MSQPKRILKQFISDLKSAIWVIIGLVIYWTVSSICFGEFCPMKILTGIPCPGCGMTRAVVLMFTGHFAESFEMHPMALAWILLGLYFCICRYILNRKPRGAAVAAIGLCVLMLPLYIYRMETLFPDHVPMTYTKTPIGDMILAFAKMFLK